MFFSADDDEQDFMSTGGSKLANLFGMDKASGQGGNASLTYTAPKQPKKKEAASSEGGTPVVVVASVVHAFKYVDNKYASQGKLGAALLANHAAKDYRILLYVNKQQQVTNAKVTQSFSFNIQENNYASFYDDARQTWSVMFDSAENVKKFAKELAVAKANSGPLTELVQQDMCLGEGGPLETGDSVEVKYTGWLLTNGTFGQVFDSNVSSDKLFRFKVGRGKVIKGWDTGVVGMKKGGKRLLVVPPALGYGTQGMGDRIPANSTLIFEVDAVRVKLQKTDSPQESPAPTPAPPVAAPAPQITTPSDPEDSEEPGIKGRTRSINEHIQQPHDTNKAKLISRMARMGQPMLPFQGAVAAQPDDSDEELHRQQAQMDQSTPPTMKPSLPAKPASLSHEAVIQPQPLMAGQPGLQAGVIGQSGTTVTTDQTGFMVNATPMAQAQLLQQQQQQQPAFLQNLPGAQQLAVYQNPNTFLQQQQQQAALLQQQQQLLQQQQQQQQVLGQTVHGAAGLGVSLPQSLAPTPAPPTSSADSLAPVLLTETRQQNSEVRLGLSKMSDKVDRILEKVDKLQPNMMGMAAGNMGMGMMSPYAGGMPAPSMEANVLMQNITRIVQENERLKKEAYEQSNKVHEQNEKIATLLEKNQKYVEKSQDLLEQRNEGYKNTASQSQARVLALEQEKVELATELSTSSAQISSLQLELGEFRKREGELKQKLQMTTLTSSDTKEELDRLRLQREEDEQKVTSLTASLREEKQARKLTDAKLQSHVEELVDLKATTETLERNLSERKRKAAEDRRKLEEDLEDAKISYEQTIEGLREKLRKQKTSTDAETESKVSKIEEDISKDWQAKCDRLLAAAAEKHSRQLAEEKEDKEELSQKIAELERKLLAARSTESSTEHQVSQLQDQLDEMKVWKDKYDNLRSQATAMKEKYENRISELETEKEEEEERRQDVEEKAREQRQQLQQQLQQLRSQQTTAASNAQSSPAPAAGGDTATQVKKIMNSVFQNLRGEFDRDETYAGAEVLTTILNVIKQTTLEMVSQAQPAQEEDEDSEEEEEDDDEEEVEEEEEVKKERESVLQKAEAETEPPQPPAPVQKDVKEEEKPVRMSASSASQETSEEDDEDEEEQKKEERQEETASRGYSPPSEVAASHRAVVTDSQTQKDSLDSVDLPLVDGGEGGFEGGQDSVAEAEANIGNSTPSDVVDSPRSPSHPAMGRDGEKEKEEEEEKAHAADQKSKIEVPSTGGTTPALHVSNDSEGEKSIADSVPEVSGHQVSSVPEESGHQVSSSVAVNGADNKQTAVTPPHPQAQTRVVENSNGDSKKNTGDKEKPPKAKIDDDREPPPLFDDDEEEEEEDEDSPLFGKDNAVADTLGSAFKPVPKAAPAKEKQPPAKKVDLGLDEDMKPQPPPPLFGDDSDDDDLDWLK